LREYELESLASSCSCLYSVVIALLFERLWSPNGDTFAVDPVPPLAKVASRVSMSRICASSGSLTGCSVAPLVVEAA